MHPAQTMAAAIQKPIDNGGRRLGNDRRSYTYHGHLPERRSGNDRRVDPDRRRKSRSG